MEFPLSQAGSAGGAAPARQLPTAARPKVEQPASAKNGDWRNWHPSHHPETAKADTEIGETSAAGRGAAASTNPAKQSMGGRRNSIINSEGTRCSPPANPDDQFCAGSRSAGQDVLCTMGGGYLTVTVLSTLSRALPTTAKTSASSGRKRFHDRNHGDREYFGQEVHALLSLLASLLRLGSPLSQVREPVSTTLGRSPPLSDQPHLTSFPPGPVIWEVYPSTKAFPPRHARMLV